MKKNLFKLRPVQVIGEENNMIRLLVFYLHSGDCAEFKKQVARILSLVNKDELAKRSGLSPASIYRMSHGENYSIDHLLRVFRILFEDGF